MTEAIAPIPLSESANGRTNAYTFGCDVTGQRRAYPVCLNLIEHTIGSKEELTGHRAVMYADCIDAINRNSCPATRMWTQEKDANKAIYFLPRQFSAGVAPVPQPIVADIPVTKVAPKVAPEKPKHNESVLDRMTTVSYESVLNDVIEKEAAKSKLAAPAQGESLMDIARRMLATKSE